MKKFLTLSIAALLLFVVAISVGADNYEITPYYNNTVSADVSFGIDEIGNAAVSFTCIGYRGITSQIEVESTIQKQESSNWSDLEGANWLDESSLYYCSSSHTYQVDERGTYKAIVTFTVYGSGGATDVITKEIEAIF